MSKPRADYECTHCAEAAGDAHITAIVHENLPVDAKFCPACGFSAGFTKLFNSINVIGGKQREAQQVINEALLPIHEKHADVKQGAAAFAQAGQDAMEKTYEKATPQEREQLTVTGGKKFGARALPAQSAIGMVDRAARTDTRECVYPALTGRRVRPQWNK